MLEHIEALRRDINGELSRATTLKELEGLKVRYLGKKGPLQELMQRLREAPADQRPQLGKSINELKVEVEGRCNERHAELLASEETERLEAEGIDVTLPGRTGHKGSKHPITAMMDEILEVHREMGFSVQYGPEVETDFYNFEALNFGPDHPARDMHDTFYVEPGVLLRTHTSNTQVRVMEHQQPPIRIAAPGRCYRNEDITPRAHIQFHQVEGLYIDKNVTFADLMQTLEELLQRLFGEVKTRFRASYFPFVEPGLEVDMSCLACKGKGCRLCKETGWLEVLGAGLVHPEVLLAGGIDPETCSGYAWGLGVERILLLKYGIDDIRLLFDSDLRFLNQFSFA